MLHFTMVSNEFIDDRILEYIGKLPMLKVRLPRYLGLSALFSFCE